MTNISTGNRLELRPLYVVWRFLLAAHLGGVLMLCLSAAPIELCGVALALVLVSVIEIHRRYFRAATRISTLVFNAEQRFYLIQADGVELEAEMCRGALITPWLTILRFSSEQRTQSVILTPDSVDAEEFRRLRVRLMALDQP